MTVITRQNLMAEKTRLFISVGGIALSVFLISFLLSLFQGWRFNVGRFVERVDADIWVAREGTTDFLNAASILPATMQAELATLPDIDRVDALIVRPMKMGTVDGDATAHLVGYEVDGGAGGPLTGDRTPGPREIIIDKVLGKKAGVGVDDVMFVSGEPLVIVSTSTGGDFIFSQTAFTSIEVARELLGMETLSTFFLLQVAEGANVEVVAAQVEESFEGTSAFTGDEFAKATRDRIMNSITPILVVVLLLAFVVGVAITGLTIYNATVEKAREFGILKAIGFTNGFLFRLVLEQSLVTGFLGFVIGISATLIGSQFIADVVPEFVTLVRPQDLLLVLASTLLMTIIAALMPVRRIANVDPVAVFSAS